MNVLNTMMSSGDGSVETPSESCCSSSATRSFMRQLDSVFRCPRLKPVLRLKMPERFMFAVDVMMVF